VRLPATFVAPSIVVPRRAHDIMNRSSSLAAVLRRAVIVVAVFLIAPGFAARLTAQRVPPSLFDDSGPTDAQLRRTDRAPRTRPQPRRSRRAVLRLSALAAGDRIHGTGDAPVTLNLFPDATFTAQPDRIEAHGANAFVWHGHVDTPGGGVVTLASTDGVLAGTIFTDSGIFEIGYAGDGEHEIREIDPAAYPTDDPASEPSAPGDLAAGTAPESSPAVTDGAGQIDVMILWTPAARAAAGGASAIQSLADLAVANTNTAYANSGVSTRLRLVYKGEITYTASDISTDLSRLSGTSDGSLDQAHTLRNQYGADVVTLFGSGYTAAGVCGIGYLMSSPGSSFASSAFNVVDWTCAGANLSYAHEVGHNEGMHHDPSNAGGTPAYPYSYGYVDPSCSFRTIMAYGGCPRVTQFSNPSINYNGRVTGSTRQNNARTLNNTAQYVANFRAAVSSSCAYGVSPTTSSIGSGAGTVNVAVTAGSGCGWTASSNASWITVATASGSGNGTVSLNVAANGAIGSRIGTVTIAGRTYTITQAGAPCAYTLTPRSASVPAAGGTATVTLTTLAGCSWTATSNVSWITVTSGVSGAGNRTIMLAVAANTGSTSRSGTVTIAGQTVTVTEAPRVAASNATAANGDFSGDLKADLLWRSADGQLMLWTMDGLTATQQVMLNPSVADPAWNIVGTGDLDGNGKPEIVWQRTDGQLCAWFMNGDSMQQWSYLSPRQVEAAWKVVAVADVNGDAKADVIWQHDGGSLAVWYMSGAKMTSYALLKPGTAGDTNWKIVGAGDMNSDGKPDLIWRHQSTGVLVAWFMNGVTMTGWAYLNPNHASEIDWQIRAVVDLNGDGHTDLVWQHTSGPLAAWLMTGTNATSMLALNPQQAPSGWRIVGPK
jgi:peptidyl-Asp metalloendopeptidase